MSPSSLTRLAGALVLLLVVVGPVALVVVPEAITSQDDLLVSPALFQLGLAAEAAVVGIEVALTATLWILFRPVEPWLAATAALARAVMTALQGVGLCIGIALALEPAGLGAELVDAGLVAREATILAWQVPFAVHLVALGGLLLRSSYPRVFAPMVTVAGLAYLLHSAVLVAWPASAAVAEMGVAMTAMLGELPLFVWMLVRGRAPERR